VDPVLKGDPPAYEEYNAEKKYLTDKLSDARKDAQWLLTLGAAGVLGVVIKDGFGATTPAVRIVTLIVSMVQISVSMLGALTWQIGEINKAAIIDRMKSQLRRRNWLRNASVVLLAISFVLIAYIGLQPVLCKK
jgi:hypothetical protein